MNTVKVLHCADIHIGAAESFLGENAAKRRYETLMTFEKIIAAAKEAEVDFLLIAGDLFDSNNIEPELTDRVFSAFSQIPEIKIIYAAGNHDPLDEQSPFKKQRLPENLYILNTADECIEFEDIKVRIYGRSFQSGSMQGEGRFSIVPPADEAINIMVLHGELKSDLNSAYNAITPDFVKQSGMDYIALGHVHAKSDILKLGGTHFAYCGCPEGQGFDELDDKGVYIGEITKGGCRLDFKAVSKRRHISRSFDVSDCADSMEIATGILEMLKAEYGDSYTENLYKIILTGDISEDLTVSLHEIVSRLEDTVYFAKVRDKTEFKIDTETLKNEKSLKGIFVRNMLEKIENAATSEEKALCKDALNLGLKAFRGEVGYNED